MLNTVEKIWNSCEIRVLVISSLLLQVFLLSTASRRKRVVATSLMGMFLWIAYLLADYVATYALGYLSQSTDKSHQILLFWAPFLLLHLGGQDTITAFSIEDNELWKRHLLSLISQVVLVVYILAKSWQGTRLLAPTIFMFTAGFLKYAERAWALQRASMSSLRSSMITEPDPGPNYAKFMEEYSSSIAAGLVAKIEVVEESQHESLPTAADPGSQQASVPTPADPESQEAQDQEAQNMTYPELVCKAYMFFRTFQRLFVDLILSFENRKESQDLFVKLDAEKAYKVVDIELSFMYDILHSKAAVIYTWYGGLFRGITVICTTLSLAFFASSSKHGYKPADVTVTYILLCGAVLLEIVALIAILLSLWTFAALKKFPRSEKAGDFLFHIIQKFQPEEKSKWSNKMAQFNVIYYSLNDNPGFLVKILKIIGFKETWDNYWYTNYAPVDWDLKKLVFNELKNKTDSIVDAASYRNISSHRGKWALQRKGYYKELGWSVDAELDESILLWHIATDLLFRSKTDDNINCKISDNISNYMLFLLVARTTMLPAGIGLIRFGDTCAEAKQLFRIDKKLGIEGAAKMILAVNTDYEPRHIKGDRSKSVLFDGCRLAHQLQKLFPHEENLPPEFPQEQNLSPEVKKRNFEKMWKLISAVWVEMLCFAASKCRGNFHAKQLSMGGELLTVVWFLMAHMGMGEQYRIEAGHARAKLIVEK